ncbi:hypothetical protein [Pedobacter sp. KBS0701]|nr:hypothetical protein [Pedobacter sp. KBS0701]
MQQQKTKLKAKTVFIFKKSSSSNYLNYAETEPTTTLVTTAQTHIANKG